MARSTSLGKYNFTVFGRKTSLRIEPEFWAALQRIAAYKGWRVTTLIEHITREHRKNNVSLVSVVRVYCLTHCEDINQ